jgi:hypothetical protein
LAIACRGGIVHPNIIVNPAKFTYFLSGTKDELHVALGWWRLGGLREHKWAEKMRRD